MGNRPLGGFGKDANLQRTFMSSAVSTGTLDAVTMTSSGFSQILEQDIRVIRMEGDILWENQTNDQGPLEVFIGTGFLTNIQAEGVITVDPLTSADEATATPNRDLYYIGGVEGSDEQKMLHWKRTFNKTFKYDVDQLVESLRMFVYNSDNVALTTGGIVWLFAEVWYIWV